MKGRIPWNKGKSDYLSKEARQKIGAANKTGKDARHWKGDKVGYSGVHQWIRKTFGRAEACGCMLCGSERKSKRIEWANLDGKYTREPQAWTTMCKKCHAAFDGLGEKVKNYRRGRKDGPHSEEHNRKICEGVKNYWIKRSLDKMS